ncbi:histidine phosphatase superfamily [Phascolomyces articulosus]|uniref:Multiple inositol polyphosphate phosphatase 1 n=1 Tax=Phascolomyces articulosus TaxID=60185 RepID=A0AAD5KLW5_9FUNG|nr:histidine phosphatase superfamily [Phascolomyces articulosus]
MQILFPALALVATLVLQAHGQYHHDINWVKHHLGTKSPYPVPKRTSPPKGYQLEQLQLVVRHGTRYPSNGDTEDISKIIKKLGQGNNATALAWLHDYENVFTTDRAGSLSDDGQLEQYLHGRRVAQSFPNLIDAILDGDVASGIDSASSESARTSQSATAFHMGLFEGQGSLGKGHQFAIPLFMYPDQGDKLIGIDDNCPRWENATENSDYESDLYQEKTHKATAERLTQELGVELTTDDIESIYTGCCFDVSNRQRVDTFCTLLSEQDILESEYREDLSYFYEYSYGLPLNEQVACALMQNIIQHIDEQDVRMVLKFGHTQTILFLQTFLGVHQDTKHPMLYANSSQSVIDHRIFRTSNIASMASNVEFQLLSNREGDKFVRVLVSEVPVVVPGCNGKEICPLKTLKEALASKLECNFDAICQ